MVHQPVDQRDNTRRVREKRSPRGERPVGGIWLVTALADKSASPSSDGIQLVNTGGTGMTLGEFAEPLVAGLGGTQALNLDGAVSTQMIVATPTWRWTLRRERGTINGVVMSPAEPPASP